MKNMQKISESKFDNVIDGALNCLQNINNVKESNFELMKSNMSNNLLQNSINQNGDKIKENSFENDSFSILNSVYLPNESEIYPNNNFNASKFDDIFNSKMSSSIICNNNIQDKKMPNQSIILKNEIQEFELLNQNNVSQEQFLIPSDWEYTKDNINYEIEKKIQNYSNKINQKEMSCLIESIKKCDLKNILINKEYQFNVCPINNVENLVESNFAYDKSYKEEISKHILLLNNYIYRWRNINGDGNGFYRAIIFSLLENIILTNNIKLIKEIIILFDEKINVNNPNVISRPYIKKYINNIDKNLIFQILFLIYKAMENPFSIGNPYEILIKSFNFCLPFDKGMIYFFRILIYEFILENSNKNYNEELNVKIGNLLPKEFITERGDFLYDIFFEDKLLKMDSEADKIIVYLTPFIIKCDINIIIYNFEKEEPVYQKLLKCGMNNKFKMNLLFRAIYYDIIYDKNYYEKFQKQFGIYKYQNDKLNNKDSLNLQQLKKEQNNNKNINVNENNNENQINEKDKKNKKQYMEKICSLCYGTITQKNKFNLCLNCLKSEIESQIMGFYIEYLNIHTHLIKDELYDFNIRFNSYFQKKECVIQNKKANLIECIELLGKKLNDFIRPIKKNICVQCQNNIEKNSEIYNLPCKCNLCSKTCYNYYFNFLLVNYLKLIVENKLSLIIFDSCYCGHKFTNDDYIIIYKDFERLKQNELQKYLKQTIQNNWNQKCLYCFKEYNKNKDDTYYKIELKDPNGSIFFNYKNFTHLICEECYRKGAKEVNCNICNKYHQVLSCKKYIKKGDEDCYIY